MNYRRLFVIFGLGTLLGGSLLMASTATRGTADIPFGFRVQDRELPAGTYTIEQMYDTGVLKIQNEDTGEAMLVMAPARKIGTAGDPRLVFNRYGDRYFLSQVWFLGDETGCMLRMGHLEKELANRGGIPGILAFIRIK